MSGDTTIYDIKIRYGLDGVSQAQSGLDGIGRHARGAETSLMGLKAAAFGAVAGISLGVSKLVELTAGVEDLKIGMATTMALKLSVPFEDAYQATDRLYQRFEDIAKVTSRTTSEVARLGQSISPTILGSGGSMNDVLRLTKGATTAASAFGMSTEQAGLEIQQMMNNGVHGRNRFAMMLMGDQAGKGSKFNTAAAGSQTRREMLDKALTAAPLQDAAKKFGESWTGQLTTLESGFQHTFRDIGTPLLHEMTGEISKWNTWMHDHPEKIAAFAKAFSAGLITGLHAVQATAAFVVEHRKLLMELVGAFILFKAGNSVAGSISNLAVKMGAFGGATGGSTSKLAAFQSSLGLVMAATGLLVVAVQNYGNDIENGAKRLLGDQAGHFVAGSVVNDAIAQMRHDQFQRNGGASAASAVAHDIHMRQAYVDSLTKTAFDGEKIAIAAAAADKLLDKKGLAGKPAQVNVKVNIA